MDEDASIVLFVYFGYALLSHVHMVARTCRTGGLVQCVRNLMLVSPSRSLILTILPQLDVRDLRSGFGSGARSM